jgi:two-component system cell cycle sensor histidine kinase/response regulator CckA
MKPEESAVGEIASDIIIHRLANIEGAAQNFLELALNTIREISAVRLALLASRVATYMRSPTKLQINAILDDHQLQIRRSLGPYVDFELRLHPGLLEIVADEDLLKALFSNLAVNAADAMRNSTRRSFKIFTWRQGDEVIVEVSDTGCGMDSETKAKIEAGKEFTTKGGLHLGKGMSHIRKILSGLSATMKITTAPGLGTSFTIRFPASSNRESHR